MSEKILILHNIRSVINVGAIFRTADAVGLNKVYLSGYTPTPIDRFGRIRNDFKKASLGSEKNIDWEQFTNLPELLKELKQKKYKIISLEQNQKSIDYKKAKYLLGDKTVIIVGSETEGIEKKILDQSDLVIEIPMGGIKESLNVSVATGILLYQLFDK